MVAASITNNECVDGDARPIFMGNIGRKKKENYNNEQERNLSMTAAARYAVLSIRVYTIV